jgi:hypothetical protein
MSYVDPVDIDAVMAQVSFPGYTFIVERSTRVYLQATFMAPCADTGALELQHTRKWYLSQEATVSEIVQTALKLVLTAMEHEARERFMYKGFPVFGPHLNVEQLLQLHIIGTAHDKRVAS